MREQNRHNQKKTNHQKSGKDLIQRGLMVWLYEMTNDNQQ
jgi:hypothetical protein